MPVGYLVSVFCLIFKNWIFCLFLNHLFEIYIFLIQVLSWLYELQIPSSSLCLASVLSYYFLDEQKILELLEDLGRKEKVSNNILW